MIMLKTFTEEPTPVCVLSDNLGTDLTTTSDFLTKKPSSKGMKHSETDLTTTLSNNHILHNLPPAYYIKNNMSSKPDLHHIPLIADSQRVMLQLAKSRAEAEAASIRSNLFQAGFQDCASEVIRFLREQEDVNTDNSLVQGLQSHLSKMGSTICGENIHDLELKSHSTPDAQFASPTDSSLSAFSTNSLFTDSTFGLHSSQPSSHSVLQESSSLKRKRSSPELDAFSINPEECDIIQHGAQKRVCQDSRVSAPLYAQQQMNESVLSPYTMHILGQSSSPLLPPLSISSFSSSSSPSSLQTTASHQLIMSSSFSSAITPSTTSSSAPASSSSSSLPHSSTSILELQPHLVPGISTSSLASGNLADLLLAVESCQSHENPRVRELATTIIDLIHHNDDEEDDEDDEDVDETESSGKSDTTRTTGNHDLDNGRVDMEDNGNNNNNVDNNDNNDNSHSDSSTSDNSTGRDAEVVVGTSQSSSSLGHDDSGIDIGEDWCNPALMIEC